MYLFDTNIISELVKKQPNQGVVRFSENLEEIYLSVVSVEEIFFGLSAKRSLRLKKNIENILQTHCIILPINDEIARRAGELRGLLRINGETRTQADMLIAATAQLHQLTIVTRNTKDFDNCGVPVLNPFD
jgi:predicted nucleic acid-binding protein